MSFAITWMPQARDDLGALHPALAARIVKKVASAAADPLRAFARMSGPKLWRLRVGDFRALADIDLAGRRITVLHVGHRRNVYDR